MNIYVFGNGNISFMEFISCYQSYLRELVSQPESQFIVCDFKGADTLTMEFLKSETKNVSVFHIGNNPRYLPSKFRTKVSQWKIKGGFETDAERDHAAIQLCTHFLATDYNSDKTRKSGTQQNIETCLNLGKIDIRQMLSN